MRMAGFDARVFSHTFEAFDLYISKQIKKRMLSKWMPCHKNAVFILVSMHVHCAFKAALSVTFDRLVLEIMFLFFKNTVKLLKFR